MRAICFEGTLLVVASISPLTGRVVYVQLGAGRINDIDSEIRLTVEALLKHDDITVVVGESMLGEQLN